METGCPLDRRGLRAACAIVLIAVAGPAGAQTRIPHLPVEHFRYEPELPASFAEPRLLDEDNTPPHNRISDAGATLGRVLFYDRKLSRNQTISCASCHEQVRGFADGRPRSVGFEGGLTRRNAMALTNARYYRRGRFLWDERAPTLEEQVLMPFLDPVEMGLRPDELLARVALTSYYPPLFEAAFGDRRITADGISRALAQFIRSLVSYRSRFDDGRAQVTRTSVRFPNFTEPENRGHQLFVGRGRCAFCHTTDTFASARPRNNGVNPADTDGGVGALNANPADLRRFKAPSLRNVALTGPYMHDGRFETLEQVVEFYNSRVQNDPNLDPVLRDGDAPRRLGFTADDVAALVAFLHTLTDLPMVTDPKFSDPFRER